MNTLPSFRQMVVPAWGSIKGGLLDGWEYTFLGMVVTKGRAKVSVLAHPPHWPFPGTTPTFLSDRDFTKLHCPAPRVQHWDTATLIRAAVEAVKT